MTEDPAEKTAESVSNGTSATAESDDEHDVTETTPVRRRTVLKGLAASGGVGAFGAGALSGEATAASTTQESDGWSMKEPQMYTPWTGDVGPENAHPEYPRPQMERKQWQNLNGVWQFSGASEGEEPPIGEDLDESILVPYPVESGLSGVKRHETWMWYRRAFSVPDEWIVPTAHSDEDVENNPNSQRLLLHFERVDWEATVYVNGQKVTSHKGGYDHFVADVTDALTSEGDQELVVGVFDPTSVNSKPIGTQPKGRQGEGTGYKGEGTLEMTPSSGIWDTVWLEPVPDSHVTNLDMTPDLSEDVLRLTVDATNEDVTAVATAYIDDEKVGRVTGGVGEELELPVPDPHLWSPDDPFLYDLRVDLRREQDGEDGGKLLDRVESYFGMRSIGKESYGNTARPTLNGETLWHLGTLESGQWPDGLYTAPTDEALRYNLEAQKELGYNMVRKHVKVEPRRWFYHADQLGLLVWQDMPNMHEGFDTPPRDEATLEHFKKELIEMVTEHDNHPSMAVWIPINEGWGINNDNLDYQRELTALVSELDPERLVDPHSGYDVGSNHDPGVGDIKDVHQYGTPWYQIPEPEPDRISALGEYTSTSLVVEDHHWGECDSPSSAEEFVAQYVERVEALEKFMVSRSMSASVYTATTGLENVCNGIITYDREVVKPTLADDGLRRVRDAHASIIKASRDLMGNVQFDFDVPSTYDVSDGAEPFEVTATLMNPESGSDVAVEDVDMRLGGLPDSWTITPTTETSFESVGDGESVSATWEITPDSTAAGDIELDGTIDYVVNGEQYQYTNTWVLSAARLVYYRYENSNADSSSYDNPFTNHGATFDDTTAAEGDYSLQFDGTDDYIQLNDFGEGILHDAFTERTFETWLAPESTSGLQAIYSEGGIYNGMGVRLNDGTLQASVATNGQTVTVDSAFDVSGWTHVAAVFDNGALRLFIDGEQVAENPDVGYSRVPGHVAATAIGGSVTSNPWGDGRENFFGGNLDATSIYTVALSAADIAENATQN
ncbi:LamG-like jellyroll fold domain-containing protein [Halomarina rubra]|uniref:LamG-like jellyroll fold domain-containing protein n=1 Tax=Halomarina rubra TaxID=2071873 RepID=A0ABD6APU6_9EURY|nr:LamG-like jellyroll fold domain-containing protein [Halomarina rubra]